MTSCIKCGSDNWYYYPSGKRQCRECRKRFYPKYVPTGNPMGGPRTLTDEERKQRKRQERRRYKSLKRGASVSEPYSRQDILDMYHACLACGTKDDLTLDHVVPLALGGADSEDNIQVLCRSCNSSKGARSSMDYLFTSWP